MNAKLILATGSHAGIEEPLKFGYYMIGRQCECQIRPKSHSVSRRHCLLHHSDRGLRVFDLGSANGTRVNDHRLEPNQWLWLKSGDNLRCGKVVFNVACDVTPDQPAAVPRDKPQHRNEAPASKGAWQEFDVVSFLEAEDEAARQERYASVRDHVRGHGPHVDEEMDDGSADVMQTHAVTSLDVTEGDEEARAVLEEARRRARENASEGGEQEKRSKLSPRARRLAAIRAKIEAERADMERTYEINRCLSGQAHRIEHPLPGSTAQASVGEPAETAGDPVKLIASVLLTVAASIFSVYCVYNFTASQATRLVLGID